jgi:hypothetical protein
MVFHLFKCRYCNRQNLSAHFTSAVTSFPLKSYHRKPSGNSRYRRPGGTGIAFTVPRNAVVTLPPIDLLAVVNRSVLHSSFSAMNAAERFCRGSRSSRVIMMVTFGMVLPLWRGGSPCAVMRGVLDLLYHLFDLFCTSGGSERFNGSGIILSAEIRCDRVHRHSCIRIFPDVKIM